MRSLITAAMAAFLSSSAAGAHTDVPDRSVVAPKHWNQRISWLYDPGSGPVVRAWDDEREPVKHLNVSISYQLDPWYDMFATQLALGVANDTAKIELKKEALNNSAWEDLRVAFGLFFICVGGMLCLAIHNIYTEPVKRRPSI